jgi:hypothetical protein
VETGCDPVQRIHSCHLGVISKRRFPTTDIALEAQFCPVDHRVTVSALFLAPYKAAAS